MRVFCTRLQASELELFAGGRLLKELLQGPALERVQVGEPAECERFEPILLDREAYLVDEPVERLC